MQKTDFELRRTLLERLPLQMRPIMEKKHSNIAQAHILLTCKETGQQADFAAILSAAKPHYFYRLYYG